VTPARKRDRWRCALGALAISVSLVLGACSSADEATLPTPSTRPRADAPVTTVPGSPPLAVVLGDSNTFLATREIQDALAQSGFSPDVRGISGSGVKDDATDWLPAAGAIAPARPLVVVVALGTNDAVYPADVQAFAARAEELLAALGQVTVVWVTHTEAGGGRDPTDERRVNDVIRALPLTHPNVSVLDLAPVLAARPNLLGPDKLHYSGHGREVFAERIATAARDHAAVPA
jgi:lysophospholipase L1-like esterase